MKDYKYIDCSNVANVSRTATLNEPGRTLGFLHDYDEGKERLRNQIDAMVNVKPVLSVCARDSSAYSNIPIPSATNDIKWL